MSDVEALLAEQVRYYRERAPEYDATSSPEGDPHAHDRRTGPRAFGPSRRSGGPSSWARGRASSRSSWPRSPTMSRRSTRRPRSSSSIAQSSAPPNVRYTVGDVFTWRPAEPADLVVAAALLSHIPRERFTAFWASVGEMLRPDGRCFLFDEAPHGLWSEEGTAAPEIVMRTLIDGRRFRIVKVLWDVDELTGLLDELGWTARLSDVTRSSGARSSGREHAARDARSGGRGCPRASHASRARTIERNRSRKPFSGWSAATIGMSSRIATSSDWTTNSRKISAARPTCRRPTRPIRPTTTSANGRIESV